MNVVTRCLRKHPKTLELICNGKEATVVKKTPKVDPIIGITGGHTTVFKCTTCGHVFIVET